MQMKMVQVVINIPQIAYDAIYACKDIEKDNVDIGELGNILLSAVEKGIVLPEHHGSLIDADELLKYKTDHEMISTHTLYNAPTILEGK